VITNAPPIDTPISRITHSNATKVIFNILDSRTLTEMLGEELVHVREKLQQQITDLTLLKLSNYEEGIFI